MSMEKMLKALANTNRLKILNWLKNPQKNFPPQKLGNFRDDGVCVVFIADKLGIKQPTATQHLKVLHAVDFLIVKRKMQWTYYKRNELVLDKFKAVIKKEL